MKKIFLVLALAVGVMTANAQEVETSEKVTTSPSTGDYFQGYTRPLTFNRMIPPYALEVTFKYHIKSIH